MTGTISAATLLPDRQSRQTEGAGHSLSPPRGRERSSEMADALPRRRRRLRRIHFLLALHLRRSHFDLPASAVEGDGASQHVRSSAGFKPGTKGSGAGSHSTSLHPLYSSVTPAGLIERKRFDIFLRVAAAIAKHQPQAIFLIAGDGSDRPGAGKPREPVRNFRAGCAFSAGGPTCPTSTNALDLVVFNRISMHFPERRSKLPGAGVPRRRLASQGRAGRGAALAGRDRPV